MLLRGGTWWLYSTTSMHTTQCVHDNMSQVSCIQSTLELCNSASTKLRKVKRIGHLKQRKKTNNRDVRHVSSLGAGSPRPRQLLYGQHAMRNNVQTNTKSSSMGCHDSSFWVGGIGMGGMVVCMCRGGLREWYLNVKEGQGANHEDEENCMCKHLFAAAGAWRVAVRKIVETAWVCTEPNPKLVWNS